MSLTYHCHQCGRDNAIVNACGCDPNNLPTRPDDMAGDLVAMARAASHDERLSSGVLYRKLADEIERLRRKA